MLNSFLFPRSVAVVAVIGELKAVTARSHGGKGEGVVDALLIRGSPSPLSSDHNTELLFLVKFTVIEDFPTSSFSAPIYRSVPVGASISN